VITSTTRWGNGVVGACVLDGISMISKFDLSFSESLAISNAGSLLEYSLSKFQLYISITLFKLVELNIYLRSTWILSSFFISEAIGC